MAGNDPVAGLRQVAAESESYYLLGYAPAATRPGERKVRVRVKREGLVVRARSRYYVERAAEWRSRPREAKGGGAYPLRRRRGRGHALAADTTGLPLRASTLFFDANAKGEVATLVAAEVSPRPGRRHLKLVAEARRADGARPCASSSRRRWRPAGASVVLAREWRLPSGVWQLRVLAEDAASGRVGTVDPHVRGPRVRALRVSTPILTDEVETEEGGARPRLRWPDVSRRAAGSTASSASTGRRVGRRRRSPRRGSCAEAASWSARARRRDRAVRRRRPRAALRPLARGRRAGGVQPDPPVRDEESGDTVERTENFDVS